ncbi:MAG: DNA-protecting protein DprA [Rhodospirillaceae bacterium]|jgi:DNA processing protein|nr:DNA-protecting protein DprA [Rhodospirillaceae bacterium]MBT5658664.1 DNA-protecting protein DprA [Rhodospirillaceae bacterium]MBT5753193.1 DNA-protecting protein DprA [Rhodospirillaceae bacterium]
MDTTSSAPRALSANERLDLLRLTRSENVGPITFRQLMTRYGTAGAALEALPELARRGGRRKAIKICSIATAERELAALKAAGAHLVALGEPDYPLPLANIEDAPPVLTVFGHTHLLQRPAIAIVGARNASGAGRKFARELAAALGREEIVVVSGMARGIDTGAHEGALQSGTIAVLAGGADHIYPKENEALYRQICGIGAVVAEDPLGRTPKAQDFPRRNRIVSGLSYGVTVIEAARRSGSLITARLAGEQGREVGAVPGSPLDPRCQGTNDLIANGATLVQSVDDILQAVRDQINYGVSDDKQTDFYGESRPSTSPENRQIEAENELETARRSIEEILGPTPVTVDEVVRQCQLSPAMVSIVLLEFELAGRIARFPGGQVSILQTS